MASSASAATGAYLQWKSVCYREAVRSVTSSTGVTTYDLRTFNATRGISVAYAYFGDRLTTPGELLMRMTNVSFGLAGDHFYPSTNYSVWYELWFHIIQYLLVPSLLARSARECIWICLSVCPDA